MQQKSAKQSNFARQLRLLVLAVPIAVMASCGGGGGDSSPAAIPTPTPTQNLMISEVASVYYGNDVAWIEVYNPNSAALALSAYSLRSTSIDSVSLTTSATPTSFALPAVTVPANGYLVIASKIDAALKNNNQIVYVGSDNAGSISTPFWSADGAVELVRDGQTADFVRFGNATVEPLTAGLWNGANVAAISSGPLEHGKSIVRLLAGGMTNSHAASDWSAVNFATPAGPNDIAPGVLDTDGDGIPDSAKIQGGTYGGLDLYAMGARPGVRDVFMEIDYMGGSGAPPDNVAGMMPRKEALQKMADTFAAKDLAPAKNIKLHLDVGNLYSPAFDPAQFNLGGGNAVGYAKCTTLSTVTAGCSSLYDYKNANFDVRRRLVFHYAVFGNSQQADGSNGSSGVAELNGNDILITLGTIGFSTNPGTELNLLINGQASTLMHEFGHNLGLRHGGNEDKNFKPNYYSVMNYTYGYFGLSATPNGAHAADRYFLSNKVTRTPELDMCQLENSPCGTNFIMDFSNGSSANLNENTLLETDNIGRGAVAGAYADWNNDNGTNAIAYAQNLHLPDAAPIGVLTDFDDWSNISVPFGRYLSGSNSGQVIGKTASAPRTNPMNQRPRTIIAETPMPAQTLQAIRRVSGLR